MFSPAINRFLDACLDEDIGRGDLTSAVLRGRRGSAYLIAKQSGVLCGALLAQRIFQRLDSGIKARLLVAEGSQLVEGQRFLELEGPATALVAGERTALNLVMRLSGIATATAALVAVLEGTGVKLADTRKTSPGLRVFEKYAFQCGGGVNHRLGLDDAAMLKENHLAWVGVDIEDALKAVRNSAPWPIRVIVEAETFEQAQEAVKAGADGVLLDEIAPTDLKILVPKLRKLAKIQNNSVKSGQVVLEASGVDVRDLSAYAATGIDMISTSVPVTRSPWLDMSMRFDLSE